MELAYGLVNLVIGVIISFIGFGKINPLHNKSKDKQVEFYKKWGLYLKAGGIAVATVGFLRLFFLF